MPLRELAPFHSPYHRLIRPVVYSIPKPERKGTECLNLALPAPIPAVRTFGCPDNPKVSPPRLLIWRRVYGYPNAMPGSRRFFLTILVHSGTAAHDFACERATTRARDAGSSPGASDGSRRPNKAPSRAHHIRSSRRASIRRQDCRAHPKSDCDADFSAQPHKWQSIISKSAWMRLRHKRATVA